MFHEQNHGRVMDREAYDKEIAKHMKENEFLYIIRSTRKAMKEIREDGDVLQEDKKRLASMIGQLLKARHGSKRKLRKIKSILEE
ncbi:hypothetical protein D1007_06201 [Hordeum vulgare]|nr:hypothetical protein D1007_06201 [Hordeum vulgare]